MSKLVYKIRRRSDGLFSAGGGWPNFKKKGKQWPSLGALHAHFNMVTAGIHGGRSERYDNCEIVDIEIDEHEIGVKDVNQYIRQREASLQQQKLIERMKAEARIKKCPSCKQPLKKGCHA